MMRTKKSEGGPRMWPCPMPVDDDDLIHAVLEGPDGEPLVVLEGLPPELAAENIGERSLATGRQRLIRRDRLADYTMVARMGWLGEAVPIQDKHEV